MDEPATIAVLDIGKSNVKLSACTRLGHVAETLSTPNPVRPGPPWPHHDIAALLPWVIAGLGALCRRHPVQDFVASGHGSGCMMVGSDPDAGGTGLVLPMIDYEAPLPDPIARAYAATAGTFAERGSAMMMGASHIARQMVWAETAEPARFAAVRHVLGVPQYWAWWLSGVAASEVSILGAQSHLWNVAEGKWSATVARRGWGRLLPPVRPASAVLGALRPALQARHGLPPLRIRTGAHDSSVAFHRYQRAGARIPCVVSTGTWIVALAAGVDPAALDETRGMTLNADLSGRPVGGALTMGGREFAHVAGDQPEGATTTPSALARIIAAGTFALPSFSAMAGQFPGSAGRGRILGPAPATAEDRLALATLYAALLTRACATPLAPDRPWVLDGTFLREPLFAPLIAALRPGAETLTSAEPYGIAAGAALLSHDDPAPMALAPARPLALPGWQDYAARWHALAKGPT